MTQGQRLNPPLRLPYRLLSFVPALGLSLALGACAETPAPRPGGGEPPKAAPLQVSGVVSPAGVECPLLQGDDGKLYSLTGLAGEVEPGTRLRVTGEPQQASTCMQGTTLAVTALERLP